MALAIPQINDQNFKLFVTPSESGLHIVKDQDTNKIIKALILENFQSQNRFVRFIKIEEQQPINLAVKFSFAVYKLGQVIANPGFYQSLCKIIVGVTLCVLSILTTITAVLSIPLIIIYSIYTYGIIASFCLCVLAFNFGFFEASINMIQRLLDGIDYIFDFLTTNLIEKGFEQFCIHLKEICQILNGRLVNARYEIEPTAGHDLEEELVLNARTLLGQFVDPVTSDPIAFHHTSPTNFRLGSCVLPVRSVVELMVKHHQAQLDNLSHPILDRNLTEFEFDSLSHQFSRFFNTNMNQIRNLLSIRLTQDEINQFPEDQQKIESYLKAYVFYHQIAVKHPAFTPELITRDLFMYYYEPEENENFQKIIKRIESDFAIQG